MLITNIALSFVKVKPLEPVDRHSRAKNTGAPPLTSDDGAPVETNVGTLKRQQEFENPSPFDSRGPSES